MKIIIDDPVEIIYILFIGWGEMKSLYQFWCAEAL